MRYVYIVLIILFTAAILSFKFQNLNVVTLSFFQASQCNVAGLSPCHWRLYTRHAHRGMSAQPDQSHGPRRHQAYVRCGVTMA